MAIAESVSGIGSAVPAAGDIAFRLHRIGNTIIISARHTGSFLKDAAGIFRKLRTISEAEIDK